MNPFLDHVRLMARYNAWMNDKVYETAAQLPPDSLAADRGAFFGSVLGTLNHLAVTDTIWMQRLSALPKADPALAGVAALPAPTRLDETLFSDLPALRVRRTVLDAALSDFIARLDDADLSMVVTYRRMNGEPHKKALQSILSHLFNHQTHHRGQITTLLSQAGLDVGVTDVLVLTPDAD